MALCAAPAFHSLSLHKHTFGQLPNLSHSQGLLQHSSSPSWVKPCSPLLAPTAGGQWHMKCMWNLIGVYNANNLSRQHLTKAWVWHGKKKKKAIWKFRQHNLSDFILYTQMKEGISKHDLHWAVLLDLPELSFWSCSKSQRGRCMGSWLEKAFLQEFQNFAENLKTFFQSSAKRENSSDILLYKEQFLWKCHFFHQNINFLFEENRFESKFLTSPSHPKLIPSFCIPNFWVLLCIIEPSSYSPDTVSFSAEMGIHCIVRWGNPAVSSKYQQVHDVLKAQHVSSF